jgi:hypothetical protein
MSIKLMSEIWEHSEEKGAARLLLLALADNANDQGVCWPSLETLARKTRCEVRSVQRMLVKLVENGSISRKHSEGPNGVNIYCVNRPWQGGDEIVAPDKIDTPGGRRNRHRGGDEIVTGGVTKSSNESSWNHHGTEDSPTERDACAPAAPDTPPAFVADDPQPDTLPTPEPQPQTEPSPTTLSGEADEKESMPAAARDKNHNTQPGHPRSSAHPAVRACREITGRSPNQVQRQAIVAVIGDTEESLQCWRSTLQRYMTQGRNPTNVEWMLDCYRQPEKLEPPKPKSNTKSSRKEPRNGRRNRSRHPDAAVEEGDESKSYPSYLQV